MNKPEYDFSKHVKVPDEWIERALAVPKTHQAKPRVFLFSSRRLITAASIMMVLTLSISLYFYFRNINTPVAVAPPPVTDTAPTEAGDVPVASESTHEPFVSSSPSAHDPTEPPTTAETTPKDPIVSSQGSPTYLPTDPESVSPSPNPTSKPIVTPTEEPHTRPDSAPIEDSDSAPTDGSESPAIGDFVIVHTVERDPSEGYSADVQETVYCSIYDSLGNLIGDSDLFSGEHIAQIMRVNNEPCYVFTQERPGYAAASAYYTYVFYNRNGLTLATGRIT